MFLAKIVQFLLAYGITWAALKIFTGQTTAEIVLVSAMLILFSMAFAGFSIEFYEKNKVNLMSKSSIIVGGVLAFVAFIGMWFAGNYNSLVTAYAEVENAWAKVETQYQRRFDLVDNLVASVKAGQQQEIEVFGMIAESRRQVVSAGSVDEKVAAINQMETSIALLPRLQEAYPELKSNQLVQSLMAELAGTENAIAEKRDGFNSTATNYNINITRFPKSLFAAVFDFEKAKLFESTSGAENAVKVNF